MFRVHHVHAREGFAHAACVVGYGYRVSLVAAWRDERKERAGWHWQAPKQRVVAAPPRARPVTTVPPLAQVRQRFATDRLADVPGGIHDGFAALDARGVLARVKPGARIAVTGGSRGIADIPLILRSVVNELKARGAEPFLDPGNG